MELDKSKSRNDRYALTGVRRSGEAAFFGRIARVAYDPRSRSLELDKSKSGNDRYIYWKFEFEAPKK